MKKIFIIPFVLLFVGAACTNKAALESANNVSVRGFEKDIQVLAAKHLSEVDTYAATDLAVDYGDVTGDGVEDAFVPIPSGGTAGVTSVAIYQIQKGNLKEIAKIDGYKMTARAADGKLQITEYNPENNKDLELITEEEYAWNGKEFVLESSQDINITGE